MTMPITGRSLGVRVVHHERRELLERSVNSSVIFSRIVILATDHYKREVPVVVSATSANPKPGDLQPNVTLYRDSKYKTDIRISQRRK
jgi:hypothetical protein